MYYLFHLAVPILFAFILAMTNGFDFSLAWLEKASESFGSMCLIFSLPYLIWALATSYFEASKATTVGGFIGAHALLVGIGILVAVSSSTEAGNGWFLYIFGWPITILIGALLARKISKRRAD